MFETTGSVFFSIILTTFNRSSFIMHAIESVLYQTFDNFELIIIDDCSTDNTFEILQLISDQRVIVVQNAENKERCFSRNYGINIAKGKYVLILDSDDYFEKFHLENWYKFIESENFPNKLFFSNKKVKNNHILKTNNLSFHLPQENIVEFFFSNSVIPGQVCLSRDIAREFPYIQKMVPIEDTELWIRISYKKEVIFTDSIDTYIYVEHSNNSVNVRKYNVYFTRYKVLKNLLATTKIKHQISRDVVQEVLNKTIYGIIEYHAFNSNKIVRLYWILFSLVKFPFRDFKHKLLLLKQLIRVNKM